MNDENTGNCEGSRRFDGDGVARIQQSPEYPRSAAGTGSVGGEAARLSSPAVAEAAECGDCESVPGDIPDPELCGNGDFRTDAGTFRAGLPH